VVRESGEPVEKPLGSLLRAVDCQAKRL